jgi:hypothetical protein
VTFKQNSTVRIATKTYDFLNRLLQLFIVALLSGCDLFMENRLRNAPANEAASLIEKHVDYYAKRLRIGMPRDEALAFLPRPQNRDTQNVCVWVFDSMENVKTQDPLDWRWLESTRGGFFLVFVESKLATPLCANAAFNPWQALQDFSKLSGEQADHILGRKP